ncbi:MAG: M23 family metallopeptidase [Ruminococcaceae bacterium]|nr:M23 family metallopeptidase [Oscillospiraceae bacterium]
MIKRRLRFGAFLIAVSVIMLGVARLLSHEKMYRMTSGEYIKWVDFDVTAEAMNDALNISLEAYEKGYDADFVKLLSYLGAKYGGDFRHYKKKDLTDIYDKIKNGEKLNTIGAKYNYYPYYLEAYGAVLSEYVGEFYIDGKQYYGLRAFSPIAKGYYYNHSDDFGASRSYGYSRKHLGHDLMGSVGTPVIAIESGYVEALGWNQYGGWRIGIRSFDNKRYYYYAHLRKDHPYVSDLKEGDIVNAGQVIGYLGMTGYSAKENVNNIKTPHLHYGIQLIFDPSQKDGYNQIWIDCYELTKFLSQNRMSVVVSTDGKDRVAEKDVIIYDIPD